MLHTIQNSTVVGPELSGASALPGFWHCDVATDTITWTEGVYEMFGYPRDARLDRREVVELYSDEIAPQAGTAALPCHPYRAGVQPRCGDPLRERRGPLAADHRRAAGQGRAGSLAARDEAGRDRRTRGVGGDASDCLARCRYRPR
ncbi:hypothetical protein ACFSTD_04610 [Novosphingobium colocasiae]